LTGDLLLDTFLLRFESEVCLLNRFDFFFSILSLELGDSNSFSFSLSAEISEVDWTEAH